jgi:hypothetical protein
VEPMYIPGRRSTCSTGVNRSKARPSLFEMELEKLRRLSDCGSALRPSGGASALLHDARRTARMHQFTVGWARKSKVYSVLGLLASKGRATGRPGRFQWEVRNLKHVYGRQACTAQGAVGEETPMESNRVMR